jgi:hypothetical protein
MPVEGAAHGRGRGQGAGDDGARVDAAGPVGGDPAGAATQQAVHGGGRDGGEQADAVDAVVAQHGRLAGADSVQGLYRQRCQPVGDLLRSDSEDTARLRDLRGGSGREPDRRTDADADVDPEPGQSAYLQDLPELAGTGAVVAQRPLSAPPEPRSAAAPAPTGDSSDMSSRTCR